MKQIHGGYSLVKIAVAKIMRSRTNDGYDFTMPVSHVRVTSQINCGDAPMVSHKRPSSATTAKQMMDTVFSGIVHSGRKIARKK